MLMLEVDSSLGFPADPAVGSCLASLPGRILSVGRMGEHEEAIMVTGGTLRDVPGGARAKWVTRAVSLGSGHNSKFHYGNLLRLWECTIGSRSSSTMRGGEVCYVQFLSYYFRTLKYERTTLNHFACFCHIWSTS